MQAYNCKICPISAAYILKNLQREAKELLLSRGLLFLCNWAEKLLDAETCHHSKGFLENAVKLLFLKVEG